MKLNKVSYKRGEEQVGRGFDILTNGGIQVRSGPNDDLMKKEKSAWERLSPRAQQTDTNQGFADTNANNSNFEFTSTNFQSRSRRLNTNLASQGPDVPS